MKNVDLHVIYERSISLIVYRSLIIVVSRLTTCPFWRRNCHGHSTDGSVFIKVEERHKATSLNVAMKQNNTGDHNKKQLNQAIHFFSISN